MKELVFLPDRDGRDEIGDAAGFVRVGASADALAQLSARLVAPSLASVPADDALAWRSALTLALLCDSWPDSGSRLTVKTIREDTSPFASWVLASRPETEQGEPLHLLLMERMGVKRLVGVADAQEGVRLPAQRSSLEDVAPEEAAWIDPEDGSVSDPVPFLSEGERTLLLRRMRALQLTGPMAQAYADDLERADAAETEAVRQRDEAALLRLAVRMEAVCGLTDFAAFSVQEETCTPGVNPLLGCVNVAEEASADIRTCRTYFWNGVPFARTSSQLGLTGAAHDGAEQALTEIMEELAVMSGSSVKWNDETGRALRSWLDGQPENGPLLSPARERLEASCALLEENGRQVQGAVTLTWPWNAASGAVRALLQETLGDAWMDAAAAPFSDRLTKLTAHMLGDTALGTCCACADGVLLPPLSQALADCVAREGLAGGLALDAMRFTPLEDGGIEASFLLRGTGEVRMVRRYQPDEIAVLDEAEAPGVAVWPCLPIPGWKAYYVFARGGVEVAARTADGSLTRLSPEAPAPVEDADGEGLPADREPGPWQALHLNEYPGCLTLYRDGLCLGALPNMLPEYAVEKQGGVVIGIDMGSSQTATAFAFDGVPTLMDGPDAARLLTLPQAETADDFICSLRPVSVVPTAVMLTGPGSDLFTDGHAFRPGDLHSLADADPAMLRARLKWRSDADSVRARKILLHQVMLGAALTAVTAGASSVQWRLTIADDMGDEGREAMEETLQELAAQVADETGLPWTPAVPSANWAEESAALCACLRGEGVIRGSGVSLDFGSGSTKMHLWMLNQGKPALGEVVFEGVQDMLLRFYRKQPVRLLEDLADCGDEQLLADVLALVDQFNPDLMGPRQMDKLALMLDMLLDTHRTAIGQHIAARNAAGRPTWLQSLLLETEAAMLFSAGVMLVQAGENPAISHMLPEDLPVCLTGRGAWLLETLPPMSRNALQHLAHLPMRLDHPVRFITVRPAAKPVESVAMGLTVTRETERITDAPLIRSRESFSVLMARMMQQLCTAFPAQMWLLHEGLFDWQTGSLTPAGESSIRRAAARVYDDEEGFATTASAFVRTLRENLILPDDLMDPGA